MTLPTSLFSRFVTSRSLALAVVLALVGAGLLGSPAQAQDEGEGESSQVVAQVSYMKAEPSEVGKYLNLEREIWKPIHQARVDAGMMESWALWEMTLPHGTSQPYNFATVNGYQSMADMGSFPENVWEEVHPDRNVEKIVKRTTAARDNVQGELWELVDSVPGADSNP